MKKLLAKIRKILRDRRTRQLLTRIVSITAAVVVFITTYALVLPAITMESEANCGIPAHQHDDSCYEDRLICGQVESPGHQHTDACYSVSKSLICTETEHLHDDSCFDADGNLTCELAEHTHNDSCYEEVRELVCDIPESEGHEHTADCYERVLACGMETHTHSTACYSHGSELTVSAPSDFAAVATTELGSYGATVSASAETEENSEETSNTWASDESAAGGLSSSAAAATGVAAADYSSTATAAGTASTGFEAATTEDAFVPQLEPIFFEQLLTKDTGIYYYHAEEGEEVPENSADIADWKRVNDDTELAPADLLRVYLRYTIPAGALNATNDIARYRLPSNLHLTDQQMEAINTTVNGIANQYVNLDTLEITDTERYNTYLGIEATEGTRKPSDNIDEYFTNHPDLEGQEYINAVVRAENVFDETTEEYLGQDLVFTFTPYTVQKNQHEYDAEGQPTKAGQKVNGWLCFDLHMDQIDWSEPVVSTIEDPAAPAQDVAVENTEDTESSDTAEATEKAASDMDEEASLSYSNPDALNTNTTTEKKDSFAEIVFAAKDKTLKIDEISTELHQVELNTIEKENDTAQDEPDQSADDSTDNANSEMTDGKADTADDSNPEDEADKPESADEPASDTENQPESATDINAETYPAVSFEDTITVQAGTLSTDNENAAKDTPAETAITVSVIAEEETFPLGTTMHLGTVEDMDTVASAVEGAVEGQTRGFHAVDISFRNVDGEEIEPLKPIKVSMTSDAIKQAVKDSSTAPVVVHVENSSDSLAKDKDSEGLPANSLDVEDNSVDTNLQSDRETETSENTPIATIIETNETSTIDGSRESTETADTLSFDAGFFSVYAIVYTVDFEYEVNGKIYQYSLNGGGKIALSDLIEVLGIIDNKSSGEKTASESVDDFLKEVANVEFSDESLVKVTPMEGDWELASLQAFDTEESLTVTMKNGDVFTVKVTDAPSGSAVGGRLIRYQDAFQDGQYIIFTQSGENYYALTNNGGKVQINYNKSTGQVAYNGNEPIIWDSKYVGNSGWKNRYEITAANNGQYYLTPGGGSYNNILRQYYGRVLMERRSSDNTAAFTVKGDEGGFMYLGWSNSNFAATNSVTNSIYLARVEDVTTKYTFTVTVDDPAHGTVSGTYDNGTPTGEISSFTVTTDPVDAEGYGFYDASSRPITATAKEGYTFSHWEVDNSRFVDDRILNRNIGMASDNVVLKAVFKQNTVVTDEMTEEEIEAQLTAWVSDMISDSLTTNKTAQVKDYNNRIYEVTLSASSGIRRVMPTVDLTFITDVSRSMFFPATLKEVATFTQGTKNETNPGSHQTATGEWVNSDSSLYDWLNRYGDKNTVYYTVADNAAATVMAVYYDSNYDNPADTEHTGVWRYQDSSNVNPPDGQNLKGLVVNSTGKNEPWNNNLTGKLYTQVGTLNRMDYLKMAAEAASSVVFGVDPAARVGLVTFAASANEGQFYGNNSSFTTALEAVDLKGGTNQGDGLEKGRDLFYNNHRENPIPKRVAILITDGAPNQDGVNWGTIGQSAINLKNLYGEDSIELYTLGLSMSMVGENNQNRLKEIATGGLDGGHWAMAEKGSDIVESLKTIIGSVVNEASLKGNFIDEIDEAFYPVSEDGTPLQTGQMIDLSGNKIESIPDDGKYGVITFDGTNYGVQWSNQVVGYNANGEPTWTGKVFIKAKEDFLGGNTINTNKGSGDKFVPTKYIVDGEEYNLRDGDTEKFTRTFTTPYVNVDELSLTENSTEWTVYLGTNVNPKDQLHALLDKINVREVVSSSTDHMITDKNAMLGSSTTEASETFPLKEILGQEELSQAEWEQLINQGYLNIPYSPYGHNEVGTLSLSLTKVGDTADYNAHDTTKTGEKVEQYFVTARYVPTPKRDVDYRTTPGGAPGTLTDSMRSDNAHIINVYEVPLDVYKTDGENNPLAGATFKLYKVDDDAGSKVDGLNKTHKYVEVASATSGTDGVAQLQVGGAPFGLKLGETYYLIETEAPENYVKINTVWAVQVQTEVGKFTDLNGTPIYSKAESAANGGVTTDMYPFNWDQGARIMKDGKDPVAVIAKEETEDSTTEITDGSFVSHKQAIAFRHTVQNLAGGTVDLTVKKTWQGESEKPDSVTVKLYRISEKAHKWVEGRIVPCTCTETGVREYTCSECDAKDTQVISAAGHKAGTAHRENEVEATCTTAGGYDMVTRCTVCNAIITTEHVEIDALGHVEGDAADEALDEYEEHHCYDTVVRCDRCGEVLSSTPHDHNWGEWQVTTPAQPGVAGVESRFCDHGHVETKPIAPLPNTTSITYRFYDGSYNNSFTRIRDVTTSEQYTIGSTITISWTDYEYYDANLYKNQNPREQEGWGTKYYYFNNLSSTPVSRTGEYWDQSLTYSVTVEVTENMVLDITNGTDAWTSSDPQNITITPNRSALHSAQSRKFLSSVQGKTPVGSTKKQLSKNGQPARLGDTATESSLPVFLNGVKTKDQAECGERYWEQVTNTYQINASEGWTKTIPDLPKYNEYGKEYTYYVEEVPVTGYDTTYSEQGTTNPEIINTPKVVDLTVTKEWVFANPSTVTKVEGKEWPQGVTVHVVVYSKTGENDPAPTSHAVDLTANQPTYTFTGLPEYSGGNKIEYSVVEAGITGLDSEHFNTVIEGNAESGYTIKNTEKEAGLTIIKAFEGAELTEAQKNAVTFTVTGAGLKDRATGNSVDTLTKTYAEFTEGQWVLNQSDGIVNGRTYTVTETNVNVEHYSRVTTVKVNDGEAVSFAQDGANPSGSVTMSGYQGTITITNTYTKLANLKIIKVDSNDMETLLEGALFELRKVDPENTTLSYLDEVATLPTTTGEDHKTGTDGEALFEDIADGYYEVKEAELPSGYVQNGDGVFYIKVENGTISHVVRTITEDEQGDSHVTWTPGTDEDKFTFTAESERNPAIAKVGNEPGAALPNAGGIGTNIIYLFGIILTGLACGGLVMKRRKRKAA